MATSRELIKASKISQINADDIKIGSKKINKKVPVRYHDKPLVIQTPLLEVMGPLKKTSHPNIYQMETLFRGDTKNKIDEWYDFIENIETNVSAQITNNATEWFAPCKNINFNSLIKDDKLPNDIFYTRWLVKLETNIFVDDDKKSFNPSLLKDKDLAKLIVEVPDLWIEENQCGLATIVQKIMIKPYKEKIITEYVFNDTDSEELEESDKDNSMMALLATVSQKDVDQKSKQNLPQPSQKPKNVEQPKNIKQPTKQQQNPPNSQAERIKKLVDNVKEMTGKRSMNQEQVGRNNQKIYNKIVSDFSDDDEISIEEIPENKRMHQRFPKFSSSSDGINEEDLDFND